jgi:hypothetical protein
MVGLAALDPIGIKLRISGRSSTSLLTKSGKRGKMATSEHTESPPFWLRRINSFSGQFLNLMPMGLAALDPPYIFRPNDYGILTS